MKKNRRITLTGSLDLTAVAPTVTASAATRTITGAITRLGVPSTTQRVVIHENALRPREPINRVKLLVDHDLTQSVGYMTSLDQNGDTPVATFKVPDGPAGDDALTKAANGLRDGLSVGFTCDEDGYHLSHDGSLHITGAELYEVSLCAVPDFQDARIIDVAASVAASRKETPTMPKRKRSTLPGTPGTARTLTTENTPADNSEDADEDEDDEDADDETDAGDTTEQHEQNVQIDVNASAGRKTPRAKRLAGAPRAIVTPPTLTLATVTKKVAAAINTGSPVTVRAALADVVPADDAGTAWIGREDWLGELFTMSREDRPWIDAFGTPQQLTTMKTRGYRIVERPKPGKYAGNKAEVPTNKPKTELDEWTAERWAGGWDIDRIFLDLGDPTFLSAFWQAAMTEYKIASNADIATKVIAAAGNTGTSTSTLAALSDIARDLRRAGGRLDRVFLADDLFDAYSNLKAADVPAWLSNAVSGVSLRDGEADISDLKIEAVPELAAGTILGFDSRAAVVREKQPIQVQALDIAHAGIDLGFYSYGLIEFHDPNAIVKRTVKAPAQQ